MKRVRFCSRLDQRPALELSLPRPGYNPSPITALRFGFADAVSGINPASLSVTADLPLAGRPAGAQLADLARSIGDGLWEIPLGTPIGEVWKQKVRVSITDNQGNITRVERTFSTIEDGTIFADGFESGDTGAWAVVVP